MSGRRLTLILPLLLLLCIGAYLLLQNGTDAEDGDGPPTRESGVEDPGSREPVAPEAGDPASPPETDPGADPESGDEAEGETGSPSREGEERPFSYEDDTQWSVTVKVLDANGEPADCKVEVLDAGTEWSFGKLPGAKAGSYSGNLPDHGRYLAVADREGTRMRVPFEISAEEPHVEVLVKFEGSGGVSGTVFTAAGGVDEDVRGDAMVLGQNELAVELVPDRGPGAEPASTLSCRVDERGGYRIAAVSAGSYFLRIRSKFYAARITVGEAQHLTHDVHLGGGRIYGRVIDKATGEPLQDVQVVIRLADPGNEILKQAGFATISDRLPPNENGDYEFRHLPLGEYRTFCNGMRHAPSFAGATLTEAANEARLDFALDRGSFVDIAIGDSDGAPIQGAMWLTQGIRCGFMGNVAGLRAGTADFIAFAPGYELQVRPSVVFKPGEATKLEFRLAPAAPTTLTFSDPQGSPIEGVHVSVMRHGRDLQPLLGTFLREQNPVLRVTGADGSVSIRGVPEGVVRVVAKRSGFALHDGHVQLKPGRETLRLVLEPADTTFTWRVRVTRVNPGSTAEKIGLRPGDVIAEYGGADIDAIRDLAAAIRAAKEEGAETVKMVVLRDGGRIEVEVVPGVLGVSLQEFEEE